MKISVIIPMYNSAKWLEKLWLSINNQTIFDKLEIIFINDGSTDDSLTIMKRLTKKKKNVIIIDQPNMGVSGARNVGIQKASCEFITFIDSDDFLDNDYFELLLNNSNVADMIVTGFINNYSNFSVIKMPSKNEMVTGNVNIIKDFLIGKIEPNSTNKLFKKNILGNLKFDCSLSIAEDKFFIYNYLKKCKSVFYIADAKYHYNHNNDNAATKTIFNKKKFCSLIVSKNICDDIKKNYSQLYNYALSSDIDVKCRVYCDIYKHNVQKKYEDEYKLLKKEIKKYSMIRKIKYSNKKHSITLLLAKLHPSIYLFVKDKIKMQFK